MKDLNRIKYKASECKRMEFNVVLEPDAVFELVERLEAAEQDRDNLSRELDGEMRNHRTTCLRLLAHIEECKAVVREVIDYAPYKHGGLRQYENEQHWAKIWAILDRPLDKSLAKVKAEAFKAGVAWESTQPREALYSDDLDEAATAYAENSNG